MVTKDDVKGIRALKDELDCMRDRLEELQTRAVGVGAIVIDGMPHATSNTNAKEQTYANYIAEVQRYEVRLAEYGKKLNAVEDFIASLPPLKREVIRLKYIDGYTLEDLAERLDYSVGAIKYHIKKALEILQMEDIEK